MEGVIYTTGEFARKAGVSVRTIRYYDKQGILKPSHVSESGYRLYTDGDFGKLQKILTLKYLGFSLEEIQEISMNDSDQDFVRRSLELQMDLVRKKIESLTAVEASLKEASRMIGRTKEVDWKTVLHLIHLVSMEKSLAEQYRTGANTSVRISLHRDFGVNPEGWFTWLYRQLDFGQGMSLLELGAGNGELWWENLEKLPGDASVCLSDISAGMMQDAREKLKESGFSFQYAVFDCHRIPMEDRRFQRVTANHVLFYLKDPDQALAEIERVMTENGLFVCSTYGECHMQEISDLAKGFDERISLSEVPLSEVFGLENGAEILGRHFQDVEMRRYEDHLEVGQAQPLIDYILSCHGNQREYIQGRYPEFKEYIRKKIGKKPFRITKDAGVFCCRGPMRRQRNFIENHL